MTALVLMKTAGGALAPMDQQAIDFVAKLKLGAGLTVEAKRHRNPGFHKKYMVLLNHAFDAWEPVVATYKGEVVQKNFKKFRGDIAVMAGHYDTVVNLRGEVQLIPKSISFANMKQDDFEDLYSKTIDVVLARILTKYTRADLDDVVERILRFA